MKGFKDFVMRGNLVELAVAFIIGAAFATLVTAFTGMLMDLIGKLGDTPNFSAYAPGGVHVGTFLTALISFLLLAAVVYFFVVKPYEAAKKRWVAPADEAPDPHVELLTEIRDALVRR